MIVQSERSWKLDRAEAQIGEFSWCLSRESELCHWYECSCCCRGSRGAAFDDVTWLKWWEQRKKSLWKSKPVQTPPALLYSGQGRFSLVFSHLISVSRSEEESLPAIALFSLSSFSVLWSEWAGNSSTVYGDPLFIHSAVSHKDFTCKMNPNQNNLHFLVHSV